MKKILHVSFAFVFTVLTVGITINKHYSGGELFSFALYGESDSCCDEPCDCCDDESEVIQFTADYLFSINQYDHTNVIINVFFDNILDPLSQTDEVNDSETGG